LENLNRAGVLQMPKPKPSASRAKAAPISPSIALLESVVTPPNTTTKPNITAAPSVPTAITTRPVFDSPTEHKALSPAECAAALEVIQREVAGCTRCAELAATRTQTVFGIGNPAARICFFGEAPGADEDRQGIPFVGRAGQLLTKMIEACRINRDDVYIMNVLKCRPPENRNPLPHETANCRGYFERQLEIIRPEIICCVGTVAAQALLCTDRSIGKLRKQWHDYRGTAVICTYHPAYLLRNPAAKVDAWEDLKMMMRRLGVEL
jgi:DNA polymerase